MLACLVKKSLIPIQQQIFYYKNLFTNFLSVFLWLKEDGFDLNNVKKDGINSFLRK